MHALRRLHIHEQTHDLDQVLQAFTDDARLLILRMAHRVNDVRHLERFAPSLRKQIARETLHMYASIAGRLGMQAWRIEMEDRTFPLLQPRIATRLQSRFASKQAMDQHCLEHTQKFLQKHLRAAHIDCRTETRIKSLYSTYQKMVRKHRRFEDLTDRLALRIITKDAMDCYRALAVAHEFMHPIPGKLKDYIGAPKENGYRSIHTVVYPLPGVTEQPIEIQIRTEEMHRLGRYGPAAHGQYKSLLYALSSAHTRVALVRDLETLRAQTTSPGQFAQALGKYFREDHLAVFDAKNNLYHLPKPLTALDFVCTVFPGQFARLRAVKVNGREQHVGLSLKDGDTVEAVFGRTSRMNTEWLRHCEHAATKQRIRSQR
jgi:GTP pyrophosphokinase